MNANEAEQAQEMFRLYLEIGTLAATAAELGRRGIRTKTRTTRKGRHVPGRVFNKASLHQHLTNPVYIGRVRLKRESFPGVHERIPATPPAMPRGSDRAARMLALAHHLDHLIEEGVLQGYAQAARLLGVSRARVTQIMDLLGLPATIQEQILAGGKAVSERSLRTGQSRVSPV